jgi:hypothetical protein
MVVMPHRGSSADAAVSIRQKIQSSFPLDLLVQSPARLRRRMAGRDYFLREIMARGVVLYAA